VNLMWQPGETINFTASHHLQALNEHARRKIIDCVVLNSKPIPPNLRKKYARAHVQPVENDFEVLSGMGVKVVAADLVGDTEIKQKIRHDSSALAEVVIDLASRSRAHRVRKSALNAQRKNLR
jgi:uncharacterized cofD-like protein